MSKKLSIIFNSLKRGGGNRMLVSIQNKLIMEDYECECFFIKTDDVLFNLNEKTKKTFIPTKKNNLFIKVWLIFLLCLKARKSDSEFIIFSDPIIGIFSFLFQNKKIIRYVQGNDKDLFDQNLSSNYIVNFIYKLLFSLSKKFIYHKVIFNSDYSKKSYLKSEEVSKHDILLPFVFNKSNFLPKTKPSKKIITVLSKNPRKGLNKFFKVLNSHLFDDYKFTVISQDAIHLPGTVNLKKPLDDNDFLKSLSENDFFLSFSSFESFGLPPIEAMSAGLIVFYFPNEGLKNYCNESNSIMNEFNDLNLLKKQLDSICRNNKKFELFSKNAIETSKRFSEELFQKKFINLIK